MTTYEEWSIKISIGTLIITIFWLLLTYFLLKRNTDTVKEARRATDNAIRAVNLAEVGNRLTEKAIEQARRQNYETMLMHLINLRRVALESVVLVITKRRNNEKIDYKKKGLRSIIQLYNILASRYKEVFNGDDHDAIVTSMNYLLKHFPNQLTPYFSHLTYLLVFIKGADLDVREGYLDLLRADLSPYEMSLLFYYGFTDEGKILRQVATELGFFSGIPRKYLLNGDHITLYASATFAGTSFQ